MSKLNKRLGFIGIGLMGRPMTLRLLEAGFNVNVWNRSKEKLHAVVAAGASPSDTIQHLVDNSDVLLLSLSDTAAVHSVVFGSEGIAAFGKSHQYLIDLSSIQPEATVQMAQKLKASCSIPWVDAPVSGGVSGAEQGHLAIMAGGEEPSITVAREVLRPIYRQITRMGPVGSGQVTKICNQMIVSCNALVIAEMMNLAKNAGIDIHKITDALSGGFADSKRV